MALSDKAVKRFEAAIASSAEATELLDAILLEATGTLTSAEIEAMNAAPIALIPAILASEALIIDEIELYHEYGSVAFTSGGAITIQYASAGAALMTIDATFLTNAGDNRTIVIPGSALYKSTSGDNGFDLAAVMGLGIEITNATGAFASGDDLNMLKWRIRYHKISPIV